MSLDKAGVDVMTNAEKIKDMSIDELAEYIAAAEVESWIWFSITGILCSLYNLCKCAAFSAGVIAEDVIQCAAEHCLDTYDLVTAVYAA